MATRVRFRFNKLTGEVEEFLVDDGDRHLPEAEHDRRAAEVGRFVVARPRAIEVLPGDPSVVREAPEHEDEAPTPASERVKQP